MQASTQFGTLTLFIGLNESAISDSVRFHHTQGKARRLEVVLLILRRVIRSFFSSNTNTTIGHPAAGPNNFDLKPLRTEMSGASKPFASKCPEFFWTFWIA
jgi:hypothetical protein